MVAVELERMQRELSVYRQSAGWDSSLSFHRIVYINKRHFILFELDTTLMEGSGCLCPVPTAIIMDSVICTRYLVSAIVHKPSRWPQGSRSRFTWYL